MQIRIRPVTEADCYDLWSWRNHPMVRRGAFNSGKLDRKEHEKWFNEKIKDQQVSIYIAESKDEEKLGQVRFEVHNEQSSYINVNLNPLFFEKGLGSRMIEAATRYYFKEKSGIKKIIAEVMEENTASLKAFEKAGYLVVEDGKRGDKKIKILIQSR